VFELLRGNETEGAVTKSFVGNPNHGIGTPTGKLKK
jgi:hypothetical protein